MAGIKAAVMVFKAIKVRLRSGLKGIKGEIDGGGAVMTQRYPEAWRGRRGARWRGGGEKDDRWAPGVSGGEREGDADGMRETKKKTYFTKYAKDARAERL
jgi:hypothetical protein